MVEIGFMAARTRSASPVDMPPSVPPDLPDVRTRPDSPGTISSWASEPRTAASAKPSPTSTPLIAWMPMRAPASRESSRRSQWTWLPRPGGRPKASTSTTPPRVSPSRCAAAISASMAAPDAGSRQRTGLSSMAGRSDAVGTGASVRHGGGADAHDVAEDLDAGQLAQEGPRHRGQRHAGGRLAGAGTLQDRPRIGEAVLLHADEVGVARAVAG